jgi:hypothetical protein
VGRGPLNSSSGWNFLDKSPVALDLHLVDISR